MLHGYGFYGLHPGKSSWETFQKRCPRSASFLNYRMTVFGSELWLVGMSVRSFLLLPPLSEEGGA